MRVLITGARGFIGKNLAWRLREEGVEVLSFDRGDDEASLEKKLGEVEFVFHLAGVTRPIKVDEFYQGNSELTELLVRLASKQKKPPGLILTSSVQAGLNNDYGKSKKRAEMAVRKYGKMAPTYIFRLPNVFGKWARPNHSSVVATFCDNLARGKELVIHDAAARIELVYIDEVVEVMIEVMRTGQVKKTQDEFCVVEPTYSLTVGELAACLQRIAKETGGKTIGGELERKLLTTYNAYLSEQRRIDDKN